MVDYLGLFAVTFGEVGLFEHSIDVVGLREVYGAILGAGYFLVDVMGWAA